MDINKQAMEYAWLHKDEERYMNELMGYFNQLAHYFANKFKIRSWLREEFMQESTIYAIKALDKYQPSKKSTPFSYFYKVFYTGFLYLMRREKQKSDKRPKMCSFEAFSSSLSRDNLEYEENRGLAAPSPEDEESFIYINGECFDKERVIEAVREAKKLKKKGNYKSSDKLVSIILKQMKVS